jgi:glutaredoxin
MQKIRSNEELENYVMNNLQAYYSPNLITMNKSRIMRARPIAIHEKSEMNAYFYQECTMENKIWET